MSAVTDELQVKDAQRAKAKRASFEKMKGKRAAQQEFTVTVTGPDGPEEMSFLYRSIGSVAYDDLITRHPPTTAQKAKGANYNAQSFAPALLAAVCREPALTAEEWKEIFASDEWNQAEVGTLFWNAVELCNKGMDVNPTEAGSE